MTILIAKSPFLPFLVVNRDSRRGQVLGADRVLSVRVGYIVQAKDRTKFGCDLVLEGSGSISLRAFSSMLKWTFA